MAFTKFIVLAILATLVPSILGTEFMVGDDKGWTMNYDSQNWAKGKEFHVGDKLGKMDDGHFLGHPYDGDGLVLECFGTIYGFVEF